MHMSSLAPNNSAQEYLRIEPHLNWAISNARSRKLPQHLADQTKPVTITLTSQHLHTAWIFTNLRRYKHKHFPRVSVPHQRTSSTSHSQQRGINTILPAVCSGLDFGINFSTARQDARQEYTSFVFRAAAVFLPVQSSLTTRK